MHLLITEKFATPIAFLLCGLLFGMLSYPCLAAEGGDLEEQTAQDTPAADEWLAEDDDPFGDEDWSDDELATVADPLEPVNRFFFHFNDKLYFWILKPTATGYAFIFPKGFRICVRNVFANLLAPARVINNILQGKVPESGVELGRFAINSTLGILGLFDVAKDTYNMEASEEDLGQSLGFYGAGPGFYINWPLLGPSNVRDTIGRFGDAFVDPLNYLAGNIYVRAGIWTGEKVNYTSLTLGDYELFKETALDPYTAVRDAYQQFRQGRIEDMGITTDNPQ
jgi:phospholipid-binding lipoprotein MlaA